MGEGLVSDTLLTEVSLQLSVGSGRVAGVVLPAGIEVEQSHGWPDCRGAGRRVMAEILFDAPQN